MPNMSYCRFHNTLLDVKDCYESWDEPTSKEEEKARAQLLKLIGEIWFDYGDDD